VQKRPGRPFLNPHQKNLHLGGRGAKPHILPKKKRFAGCPGRQAKIKKKNGGTKFASIIYVPDVFLAEPKFLFIIWVLPKYVFLGGLPSQKGRTG